MCQFARAKRAKVFREVATCGYCAAKRQTYKGFHGHVIIDVHGTISGLILTAADTDERVALFEMIDNIHGLLIGDKGSMSHPLQADLKAYGLALQTPLRSNMVDDRAPSYVRQ